MDMKTGGKVAVQQNFLSSIDRTLHPSELTELIRPRPFRWLAAASLDWSFILGAMIGAHWLHHPIGYVAALMVIGNRQHALSLLYHDGGHRLISKKAWLNDFLTIALAGLPLGIPLRGYRDFHFKHHRRVGTDEDPELIHKRGIPQWSLPFTRMQIFLQMLKDFLGGALPHLLIIAKLARPKDWRDGILTPIFVAAVLFVSWKTNMLWVPMLWWGSMITAFWATFRYRIWIEHIGTRGTHRLKGSLWERLLFFPHNADLHWEHHYSPGVSCFSLHKLRDKLPHPEILTSNELFEEFENSTPLGSGMFPSTDND
jgi:fatty acid desaturase